MIINGDLQSDSNSLSDLETISKLTTLVLLNHTPKAADIIGCAISLLENFKFQANKLQRLGYCDYEFAFVTFSISVRLMSQIQNKLDQMMLKLVDQLLETIEAQKGNFGAVRKYVSERAHYRLQSSKKGSLLERFESLQGVNGHIETPFLGLELSDNISSEQLNQLIRKSSQKVLLVDFRSQREFNYSHINFLNIVNIEPLVLRRLLDAKPNSTDKDLEDALSERLDTNQIRLFRERFKFELVVLYNLRFGGISNNRFDSLEYSLLHGDNNGLPSQSPFKELIRLLIFDNKYISSKLRRYPVYLRGGLERWFQVLGDSALTSETSRFASVDKNHKQSTKSENSENTYLRNFGEYLSTAKSSSRTALAFPPEHDKLKDLSSGNGQDKISFQANQERGDDDAQYGKTHIMTSLLSSEVKKVSDNIQPTSLRQSEKGNKSGNFLKLFTTGLINLGNSCYMNCILQCLSSTPQLTSFFFPVAETNNVQVPQTYRQHINMENKLGSKGVITTSFVKLLANMFNNSGKYFSPLSFKQTVGSLSPGGQFANADQQDCIEFLNYILDSLHEDLNQRTIDSAEERATFMELSPDQEKAREFMPVRLASTIEWERYLKLNFSVIVDYFQGQYLSTLKCLECQLTSSTYNSFSILSLPLPEKVSGIVTLDQCLNLFTETELLEEDNKWHCPRCRRFTKLTKTMTITRFPRVLIIHLKRFNMDLRGFFKKLDTYVTYPVDGILDLTSHWPSVGTYVNSTPKSTITLEREKEILASFPNRNQEPPFRYTLYGVVNHFGNLTTGHYTAYVKKEKGSNSGKRWCYFDDSKVQYDCKESQVRNQNAYCLFYLRVQ